MEANRRIANTIETLRIAGVLLMVLRVFAIAGAAQAIGGPGATNQVVQHNNDNGNDNHNENDTTAVVVNGASGDGAFGVCAGDSADGGLALSGAATGGDGGHASAQAETDHAHEDHHHIYVTFVKFCAFK